MTLHHPGGNFWFLVLVGEGGGGALLQPYLFPSGSPLVLSVYALT